jgi:DNA-directed RNA polymerase specialized sigma subunit
MTENGRLFFEANMDFKELVRKISPKLKAITHRLNGRFTFFNDEDLYQEALIYLWVDFNQRKLDDKTDSYILQGCYFHLKNYIRIIQDKKALVSLDALVETIRNNGLTEREKDIFNLALSGLTTREIGNKLGISHVRVIKLQKKIREKCREHLDNF